MAQQVLNAGTIDNDGTGDPLRTAAGKINDNFTELYSGMSGQRVVFVATQDSVDGAKALAGVTRILPASGAAGLAAKLKTIIEGNQYVICLPGPTPLVLDAALDAAPPDDAVHDWGGLKLIPNDAEANGGNSGQAAIIIGGAAATTTITMTGLAATLPKGTDTFAHTYTGLGALLPAGSHGRITTTENRNPNRQAEYFKGEEFDVLAVSDTSIRFKGALRDSYSTSATNFRFRRVVMCQNLTIRGLNIISNTTQSTPARQNGLVIRNCASPDIEVTVSGVEFADGVGVWGCTNARVQGQSYQCQDRYGPGVQGYGLRIAGSEGTVIVSWEDYESRHGIDLGMSSSSWSVTRHTKVIKAHATHTYAAGFAVHDAEFTTLLPGSVISVNCGGGIITRGSYTFIYSPVIIGGHVDTYPWGAGGVAGGSGTQSNGAGIAIGERTKITISAFDDTSANGLGGTGLIIADPYIDASGATGDFDGITCEDPLRDASIVARIPVKPRRCGFKFSGDFIDNSVIDVAVDHTTGTGSTGSYGPPSGTTYTLGGTLTASTDWVDLGTTAPAVGTELINTGGTAGAGGWGGFVPGATYFVYSTSGNLVRLASRSSGNTAYIDFTQDLTGLTWITGKRVHSAYLVPSVSSTTAQYIRRSRIRITSTACRDVPVVIGGARNGGVSLSNTLDVAVTSLGSGPTAATPVIRWVGTSLGEWQIGPVDARASNIGALHSSYTGMLPSAGGPLITYTPGRSVFADGATDLHKIAVRGPGVLSGERHMADHTGGDSQVTLLTGDRSVMRLYRVRVTGASFSGIATATAGTALTLSPATYARARVAVYADAGTRPATGTGSLLADLGVIDITGATGEKTLTLGAPVNDAAWDVNGTGWYWLGIAVQMDADPTVFPTMKTLNTLVKGANATSAATPTVRGYTASNSMTGAAANLTSVTADGTARTIVCLIAA